MKYNCHTIAKFATIFLLLNINILYAQDSSKSCKVEMKSLDGIYKGECKNGYANGKGEAIGYHRYVGLFKNGLPNGMGTYYFSDSIFYTGNFQDGIKEGKGEMHYLRNGLPDSVLKGYWSGNEYTGKKYTTYSLMDNSGYDQVLISSSQESGNTLTMSMSNELALSELVAVDGSFIKKLNEFPSGGKTTVVYELSSFPVKIEAIFSNGRALDLELYKKANWNVQLHLFHLQ